MSINIEQVKQLREATGVSMMACKGALEDAGGDFDAAVDILRKKGEAKATDRAARTTANGVVVVKAGDGKAVMVKLLCETDFVALGDDFISLANSIAGKILNGELNSEDRDLAEVKEAVLRLGENVQIGDVVLVEGTVLGDYVHSNKKIGSIVALNGGSVELAKEIAMHIAATAPVVISPEEVSQELVDKEKGIWIDQLKNEGKPEEIIEKIMMGKEKKFREENALIKQAFVKDPDKTIEQLLEAGAAKVSAFKRFVV